MKITYCITRLDEIGGAQTHLRDIATYFQGSGHEVTVVTGVLGDMCKDMEAKGIRIISIPALKRNISALYDIMALFSLIGILRRHQPDIVACHSSKAGIIGRLAAHICGIPSVFTVHGWAFTDGVPQKTAAVYKFIERCMARITTHFIAVSEYDKKLATQNNVAPPDHITVIHNGIRDIPLARSAKQSQQAVRLVMIARFGEQKDHGLLLESLGKCRDLDWTLTLAGGGDDTYARLLCRQYNLEDKVNFLGQQRDVIGLLEASDVFLLISKWEGFPISTLEALRAGLPVIVSDVGGASEAVSQGHSGHLVPRGDADFLANCIRTLVSDKQERKRMGLNGRKDFEQNYTLQQMIDKTLKVYLSCIN